MKLMIFIAIAAIGLWIFAGGKGEKVLDAETFKAELEKQSGVLIDVRTPKEYAEGHLEGSQNMNFFDEDFKERVAALAKDKVYFVYCRSGGRSAKSAKIFEENGLTAYDLAGGIQDWKKKDMPVIK